MRTNVYSWCHSKFDFPECHCGNSTSVSSMLAGCFFFRFSFSLFHHHRVPFVLLLLLYFALSVYCFCFWNANVQCAMCIWEFCKPSTLWYWRWALSISWTLLLLHKIMLHCVSMCCTIFHVIQFELLCINWLTMRFSFDQISWRGLEPEVENIVNTKHFWPSRELAVSASHFVVIMQNTHYTISVESFFSSFGVRYSTW